MATDKPECSLTSAGGILSALRHLSCELSELDTGVSVARISADVLPLLFYRQFVAPNKPAVLEGAASHWPAIALWTNEYLNEKLGDRKVTVACTPDGRADAITSCEPGQQPVFALPCEKQLPVSDVLRHFEEEHRGSEKTEVLYIQAQNNSFKTEYSRLANDVLGLPWATEVFGHEPDAVNLWIGNHRSITTFHRDHYENIYVVLHGCKKFTLLPPCDRYRLDMREVPVAKYTESGVLQQVEPKQTIAWAAADLDWDLLQDPTLPAPLKVEVHAGEALYLPSMWYHMVEQTDDDIGRVIAVNYWYDMQYDCKYAYTRLVEQLAHLC